MGARDFLERLAQSFVTRTNSANGNTAIARDEAAAQDASMMRRAQAAQIMQHIGLAPELQKAQIEQMRAHANSYNTPKPNLKIVNGDLWDMSDGANPRKVIAGASNPGYQMVTNENNDVVFVPKPGTGGPRSSAVSPATAPASIVPTSPALAPPSPSPASSVPQAGGVVSTGVKKRPPAVRAPHLVAGTDASGNPGWGVPGAPGFAPPMTQVERTRRDQASHVISQGAALIAELNKPEVQAIMGPRAGLWTGLKDTAIGGAITGGAPPEATHLASSLSSMSAFLPIMHGMRGGDNMIQHFERQMGKSGELAIRRTPEAVQAAVQALVEAARRIREKGDSADLTGIIPEMGAGLPGVGTPSPSATPGFQVIGVEP